MIHQLAHTLAGKGEAHGGFKSGFKMANEGILFDGFLIAGEVASAERGDALPTFMAKTVGLGTFGLTAGITTVATAPLLESALFFLPGVGSFVALGLATIPNGMITDLAHRTIRTFSGLDKRTRRLQMGGDYQDSDSAYNMRMRMITDMNGALGPARSYLGNEARYLHR